MNQVANSMEITETANMKALNRSIIFNEKAPAPLGTYSQGVRVGNMVFWLHKHLWCPVLITSPRVVSKAKCARLLVISRLWLKDVVET